ncbi:MAG: peptide deformylase [Clostridiales bacterium]|nr:peptide deformylase [Clostridiales bacterium]MDY4171189.1 peptide deformylase [Evtepia sp.]
MIKKILQKEDPALHKVCHPVTNFDRKLSVLIDDLVDTLEDAQGLGLAAPQVGILRRVVIVMDDDETFLELVNPEIVSQEGEQEGFEGCLSLSGLYGIVKRPMKVKVKAQDRHGNPVEYEREGITARCFCHEIEHLDGHMYYEKAGRLFTEDEVDEMLQKAEEEEN